MPKVHSFPTLYNEVKTLSITKLKEWDYLLPDCIKSGTVNWSRNGHQYANIGIRVNTFADQPYIELDYKCNDKPINYKVYLVTHPSNLGKGKVWYFLCPNTGKRCRKLYMVQTYFLHRDAFRGAMYEKQTYSKSVRAQIQLMERVFNKEEAYEQSYKKYFKKHYKGKPTKRYLKICQQIQGAGSLTYEELLLLK